MKRILNFFRKGVVSDLDYSMVDNQSWVFPTSNVRITSRNNNYIITPLLGNTKTSPSGSIIGQGEEFQLSEGFKPIGCDSLNGIAYIISYNNNTGETEIGTYPSPQQYTYNPITNSFAINTSLSGFKSTYQPLCNWTGLVQYPAGSRRAFRTALFNYEDVVDVFVRKSYDKSINIYICDGENYNRVVNSGFNQDGEIINTNIYCNDDFNSKLNQFLQTNSQPEIDDIELLDGGQLKYGNYIVYFRYVTADFNHTHFVKESKPIQIHQGQKTFASISGGNPNKRSDKLIKFYLSNLDETYKYIQIAFVRGFGDVELLKEREILTKYYEITDSSIELLLTGFENSTNMDIGELLKVPPYDQISYTHTQHANRYYGGNWKEIDVNDEALKTFAQFVRLSYNDDTSLNEMNSSSLDVRNFESPNIHYQDFKLIYNNIGYFRTEAYPFALVFELNNGNYSPAYPTLGMDALFMNKVEIENAYNNPGTPVAVNMNNMGIFRFPTQVISNAYNSNRIHLLGLEVNFHQAHGWLTGGSGDPLLKQWILDNVRKVHVVRGERFQNLRYQGLMVAACRAEGNESTVVYTDDCSLNSVLHYDGSSYNSFGSDFSYGEKGQGQARPIISPANTSYTGGKPFGQFANEGKFSWSSNYSKYFGQDYNPQPGAISNYRDILFPIFRGYAPMTFFKKNVTTSTLVNHKEFVLNYASRWFCEPGFYGFYSPDFMFRAINDIDDINCLMRVAKTRIGPQNYNWETNTIDKGTLPYNIYWNVKDEYIYTDPVAPGSAFYKKQTFLFNPKKVGEAQNNQVKNPVNVDVDFINYSCDYFEDPANTLFYMQRDAGREKVWTNRAMYSPKYIAIKNNDDYNNPLGNGNNNLDICNLYNIDPEQVDITNLFQPTDILYGFIGDGININNLEDKVAEVYFQGDCFLQRVYFKQMSWAGSKFGSSGDHESWDVVGLDDDQTDNPKNTNSRLKYFTHGVVLSIVVESAINNAMRYSGSETTFYPETEMDRFARGAFKDGLIESFLVNHGNSLSLSDIKHRHWDSLVPYKNREKITRIRYSSKIDENSFLDTYRYIDEGSFQDYEFDHGAIKKIISLGNLFSVQENSVNEHITERNEFKIPSSSGDLSVGFNDVLSPQIRAIGKFGVTKREHIVNGVTGFYGIDISRNLLIWKASLEDVGMSYAYVAGELSEKKLINNWIKDYREEVTSKTDIVSQSLDYDISGGYDLYSREVIFTIKKPGLEEQINMEKTLVFSEYIDAFLGENTYNADFYLRINKDFYSFKDNLLSLAFLHNRKDQYLLLYGEQEEMELSFIVNGNTSEELGSIIEKNYLGYEIESKQIPFARATYGTENQNSNVNPWYDEDAFWLLPEYLEDHWKVPLSVKNDADSTEFFQDSSMKGTWLKINLTYDQNNYTFVKNIITNYIDTKA